MNWHLIKQVYARADLQPYSFWFSAENGCAQLYLRLPDDEDPGEAMMEGSITEQLIVGKGVKHILIKGFQLTHACNRVQMAVLALD